MERQHRTCVNPARVRRAGCAILLLLSACVAPDVEDLPSAPDTLPPEFPEQRYLQAAAAGGRVYAIDSENSLFTARVFRDGALAHLGHEHVIAGREIRGYVVRESRAADGAVIAEGRSVSLPAGVEVGCLAR